jgi:hypothetical protein
VPRLDRRSLRDDALIRVRVCGSTTAVDPNPDCPNADRHTPAPTGMLSAMLWADEITQTHNQAQCPGCGLCAIRTTQGDCQ